MAGVGFGDTAGETGPACVSCGDGWGSEYEESAMKQSDFDSFLEQAFKATDAQIKEMAARLDEGTKEVLLKWARKRATEMVNTAFMGTAEKESYRFDGTFHPFVRIEVDPDMPNDTILFRNGSEIVGCITNIGLRREIIKSFPFRDHL